MFRDEFRALPLASACLKALYAQGQLLDSEAPLQAHSSLRLPFTVDGLHIDLQGSASILIAIGEDEPHTTLD